MLKYDLHRGWYLPSNWTLANVVLRDLDLIFQRKTVHVAILTRREKSKHYHCHQIEHRIAPGWMLTYIFKIESYDFYSGWCSPSNGTIVNVILHDLGLNFQGQTFSCNTFAIKKMHRRRISPTDLPFDYHWSRCRVTLVLLFVKSTIKSMRAWNSWIIKVALKMYLYF